VSLKRRLYDLATDDVGRLHADPTADRGQVGTVIAVVTIGIVAIIGTLIYSQVLSSVGDPSGTAAENRTQLENSTVGVTDGFGNAMQLVPVVLIVLVASLVIGVVQRFG
jgi:hypothetical protein